MTKKEGDYFWGKETNKNDPWKKATSDKFGA